MNFRLRQIFIIIVNRISPLQLLLNHSIRKLEFVSSQSLNYTRFRIRLMSVQTCCWKSFHISLRIQINVFTYSLSYFLRNRLITFINQLLQSRKLLWLISHSRFRWELFDSPIFTTRTKNFLERISCLLGSIYLLNTVNVLSTRLMNHIGTVRLVTSHIDAILYLL